MTNEDTNERSEAYFADDDLFTEYESQKQDSGEDFAWFKLANGEMSYTIEGLYDGNDELYSVSALEKNPPVLRVGKKEDDEIQFFSMRVNKEIADKLHISLTTVITHRKNIMTKLNAHSLSDVIIYAVMNGHIDLGE